MAGTGKADTEGLIVASQSVDRPAGSAGHGALAAGVDSIEDRSESFLEECYITQDLTGWAAPVFGPILIGNLGDLLQTEWGMEVFYTARTKTDPNLGT